MKKFTLKLLSLMLVCIIMLPLIMACGDETDPDEVSEVERFEAMTESEKAFYILEDISYDNGSGKTGANMTLSINGNYMGYAYTVSAVAEKLMVDNSQEFKDYTETTITITMAGMSQVSRSKSGWIDGKQFMYTELDGNGNGDGIYTEMSKEDYLKTQEEASGNYSDNFGITKDSCTTVTCTKNAQGNWIATFTGIAEDSLADFKDLLLGFEPMIDASTLTDITLTLTISANLVPVSMSVDFEFSGSNPPVVELEYDIFYGDEVVIPSIDLSAPPLGNQVGNTCYGYEMEVFDENGMTGEKFNPANNKGKITIINFWGTWCTGCKKELPYFDRIASEYSDTVTVVAVHTDLDFENGTPPAKDYVAKFYPDSNIIFTKDNPIDPSDPYSDEYYFKVLGGKDSYPITIILDENGVIIETKFDEMTYEELKSIVDNQLAKSAE